MTQAFNLAQLANNLNTSGQLDATDGLYGVLPVANGGTGQNSLNADYVLVGAGTSGIGGIAPGTAGNVLTSTGSSWAGSPLAAIGVGQTWQAPSRSLGVTYTNSTGKPIMVVAYSTNLNYAWTTWYINGSALSVQGSGGSGNSQFSEVAFIVPDGATYQITSTNGNLGSWVELR
jgi:hypothetical protein